MKRATIVLDTRKKISAYLTEQANLSLKREVRIDALEEVVTEALAVSERMPKAWVSKARRILKAPR